MIQDAEKVRDPVCGMEIDPETAAAETEYQGEKFYFCSEACYSRFIEHPEQFAEAA